MSDYQCSTPCSGDPSIECGGDSKTIIHRISCNINLNILRILIFKVIFFNFIKRRVFH